MNFAAVGEIPEPRLAVLLFNRGDVFSYVAVEGIGDIWPIRNVFHNAVQVAELLDLQAAKTLGRRAVDGIEVTVFLLELVDLFVDVLHHIQSELARCV